MDGWTDGRTDEQADGWTNGRTDGRTDRRTGSFSGHEQWVSLWGRCGLSAIMVTMLAVRQTVLLHQLTRLYGRLANALQCKSRV